MDIICGLVILSVSLLGFANGSLPWYMVGLVFMLTFFNYNIHYPNLYAFVQEFTEPQHYARITSYLEIQGQLSAILAGAFAALLLEGTIDGTINIFGYYADLGFDIEAWTIYEIFAIDTATYFAAFLIILSIRYSSIADRHSEKGNIFSRLKVGLNYLRANPLIFMFGVASYIIFMTVRVEGFYLNAMYVNNHLKEGGDVYAASEMYYAVGAVFAGFFTRFILKRVSIPAIIAILSLCVAIRFAVLAVSINLVIFYAMGLILGLANAGTRILRVTYLFTHIPNQIYGRARSIFFLTNIVARILFVALFSLSFFQEGNNVIYAFLILAFTLLITAVWLGLKSKDLSNVTIRPS